MIILLLVEEFLDCAAVIAVGLISANLLVEILPSVAPEAIREGRDNSSNAECPRGGLRRNRRPPCKRWRSCAGLARSSGRRFLDAVNPAERHPLNDGGRWPKTFAPSPPGPVALTCKPNGPPGVNNFLYPG